MTVSDDARIAALFRVLAHPLRMRILRALCAVGEPRSPNSLAEMFGERLGNVSYHVRFLLDAGVLTLTSTEPRRGAVEHYYEPVDGVDELLQAVCVLAAATTIDLTRRK